MPWLSKIGVGAAVLLGAVSLAACGVSASGSAGATGTATTAPGTKPMVQSAYLPTVKATVLVNSAGYPLYVFANDQHSSVTCTGACAIIWPPLRLPSGATQATAGPGVHINLLGRDGRTVTYDGWPLYTYSVDLRLGLHSNEASGQGLNLNGGYWYVIGTNGNPIIKQLPPQS